MVDRNRPDSASPARRSTSLRGAAAAPPLPPTRDASLVYALADGDVDALGALYDAHAAVLLALATRTLGDGPDAEDLVHDLFVEVWQRISSYDAERGSVRTWLLVRLRSRAMDRLRSRQVRRELFGDPGSVAIDAVATDESGGSAERAPDQRRALLGLGEITARQREVIELAYFEGLSLRAIGLRLGIPLGTVKSRMAAAVTALRRSLELEEGSASREIGRKGSA